MEFKDYFLVGVCVAAALLLFIRMSKENKVFIGAGILCLCYGGYHVAQAYLNDGIVDILGWVLRGVAVLMLIWMFTVLSGERAKTKAAQAESAVSDESSDTAEEKEDEVSNIDTEVNNAE